MGRKMGRGALALCVALAGCGGDGSPGGGPVVIAPTPTPTPAPSSSVTCTLRARQDWAAAQLRQWYLFPETLPSALDPTPYANVSDYVDALTATARAQGRDRYFTYVTSIAEEDDYYATGGSAGFGIRLQVDDGARRVFVSEAFEGAPALAAGLDRGAELLAIGTSPASLRAVSDIYAAGGSAGIYDAIGPNTAGLVRTLRFVDGAGEHLVTLVKADFDLQPVSSRYGARVIDDGGTKVGYVNLRTFITSANAQLRTAFAGFKAQGIDEVIVDLRYNGGGLITVAQTLASLLGGNRRSADIVTRLTYRPEKSAENESYNFQSLPESVSPRRIAFIASEGSASASELVINAFVPYLHADVALIGTNTYGKPVGQIALDQSACDDRLRVIAFAVQNAAGQGGYFSGLASVMEKTCAARDDYLLPLGDAREDSVAKALDFLAGRSCTPIAGAMASASAKGATSASLSATRATRLLVPDHPTTPQREVPGSF